MRLEYDADNAMFVDMDKSVDADGNDGGDLGEELTTMEVVEGFNDLLDLAKRLAEVLAMVPVRDHDAAAVILTPPIPALIRSLVNESRAAGLLEEKKTCMSNDHDRAVQIQGLCPDCGRTDAS